MGVFKRRLKPHQWLAPDQMLELLGELHLMAVAAAGSIHLAAHPSIAWLLQQTCTGTPGPVPQQLQPHLVFNQPSPGLQAYLQQLQGQLFNTTRRRKGAPRAPAAAPAEAAAAVVGQQSQQQPQARPGKRPRSPAATHMPASEAGHAAGEASVDPSATVAGAATGSQQAPLTALEATPASAHWPAAQLRLSSQLAHTGGGPAAGSRPQAMAVEEGPPSGNMPQSGGSATAAAASGAAAAATAAAAAAAAAADVGSTPEAAAVARAQVVHVRLTLEEAFFLQYTLGCCQVATPALHAHTAQGGAPPSSGASSSAAAAPVDTEPACSTLQPLDDQQLWDWCVAASGQPSAFPATYATYHHFRSKGWLPRSGGLYGAHYVLYRAHPAIVHSEFVVTVVQQGQAAAGAAPQHTAQEGSFPPNTAPGAAQTAAVAPPADGYAGAVLPAAGEACVDGAVVPCGGVAGLEPMAWLEAAILQRLAQQVFKQLLLVLVAPPPGGVCRGPQDLLAMSVREVHVRRWTPRPGQV